MEDYNKNFWEEFIELYRKHSCLWDVKSKDYSNKYKRNASYGVLLNKFKEMNRNATMDLVKKKINNMRTAFRRELKKVLESKATSAGEDDVYQPNLWYYGLLLFTAQYESGRRDTSTDEFDEWEGDFENGSVDNHDVKCEALPEAPLESRHTHSIPLELIVNDDTPTPDTRIYSHNSSSQLHKRKTPNTNFLERKKLRWVDLSHTTLHCDDEYAVTGKRISYQLRGMDECQRLIAEKLISDIMFYGKLGKLREDASVRCTTNTDNTD